MTSRGHKIHVKVDRKGVVEIGGMTRGQTEAAEIAHELGLGPFEGANLMFTVIRSQALDPDTIAAVRAKAGELGYDVTDVQELTAARPMQAAMGAAPAKTDDAPEHSSTIAALHAHKMGPSRREKMVLPLVLLGVIAVLVAVGSVVRDHMNHSYTTVASLADVVETAKKPAAGGGGLAGLINPDDSQFVSLGVRSWPYWNGKAAILDDHYLRVPGILEPSIEDLVKGDRGGASVLIFKFDARPRDDGHYRIDVIERGGIPTKNVKLDAEIFPLRTGPEPSIGAEGDRLTYADGAAFRHDRDQSFRGATRVALPAWVVAVDGGYRLWAEGCSMALAGDLDPGVKAVLEDLEVPQATLDRLTAGELPAGERIELNKKRLTWFLTIQETFPWREGSQPGRRQLTREIGAAHVDGVKVRKAYYVNPTA